MLLMVGAVYWPPPQTVGSRLYGVDYLALHVRRMLFARGALLGPAHALPAWYPGELLGTPFWSNVQNFPFLPTRLLILLAFDPTGRWAYPAAAILSAAVAAACTFAYARRLGLGPAGAASAGWTFAAAGFYASRIAAGHLPLLEAYAALPLLLWAAECVVQSDGRDAGRRRVILGLCVTLALLCGHPQLSIYALLVTGPYLLWRSAENPADVPRASPRWRLAGGGLASMALGAGCAAFALLPMAMLVGRSTRILALDPPGNDIAMPYGRLATWWFPEIDGFPDPLASRRSELFHGYPSTAHFWETVSYIGWLPWLAIAGLWLAGVRPGRRPGAAATYLLAIGVIGVLLSLPWWQRIMHAIPGTYLRSPARLVYLTELALSLALGAGVDRALRFADERRGGSPTAAAGAALAVAVALAAHVADLGMHDRRYLVSVPVYAPDVVAQIAAWEDGVADGHRGAFDIEVLAHPGRRFDDVGFFDSVMLARAYRFVFDLAGAPLGTNLQSFDGSQLPARALRAAAVSRVFTLVNRPDLTRLGGVGPMNVYGVDRPADRAAFFDERAVRYLDRGATQAALRDPSVDVAASVMLPAGSRAEGAASRPATTQAAAGSVVYQRDRPDRITCTVTAGAPGVLRVIESFDPGWSATLDGATAAVVPADGALLAVNVPAGRHEIVFTYRTPGARAGVIVSLLSACGLFFVAWLGRSASVASRGSREDRGAL